MQLSPFFKIKSNCKLLCKVSGDGVRANNFRWPHLISASSSTLNGSMVLTFSFVRAAE